VSAKPPAELDSSQLETSFLNRGINWKIERRTSNIERPTSNNVFCPFKKDWAKRTELSTFELVAFDRLHSARAHVEGRPTSPKYV